MSSLYTRERSPYIWHKGTLNGDKFAHALRPPHYFKPLLKDVKSHWIEAEKIKKDFEANKTLGNDLPIASIAKPKLTFCFNEFILSNELAEESTNNVYRNAFEALLNSLKKDLPVNKVTSQHIKSLISYMKKNGYLKRGKKIDGVYKYYKKDYSRHTINNYILRLRIFFDFCIERNWVKENPVQKNRKLNLNTTPEPNIDIPSEVMDLIEEKAKENIWHYRFIHLARLTMFRKIDVIQLRWEDVLFDNGVIRKDIKKTKVKRHLPLYKELYEFLYGFKKDSGYVIEPIRTEHSTKFWERIIKDIQKEKNIHKYTLTHIRNTAFTEMVLKGHDPYFIHLFTGHSSFQTTYDNYVNIQKIIDAKKYSVKKL